MIRLITALIFISACQPRNTAPKTEYSSDIVMSSVSVQESIDSSSAERRYTYWDRELEYLKEFWNGEYDNVEQIDFDKIAKIDGEDKIHKRVHTHFQFLSDSKLGDYVWYIEEYENDNPLITTRQSLFSLKGDDDIKAIRVMVYDLQDKKPLLSLKRTIDFLKEITPESDGVRKGCDLIMRREGMTFFATTEDKACNQKPRQKQYSTDYQMRISENEFWFQEITIDSKSNSPISLENQPPLYQLEKARCFVCMIDFPREENGRPVNTVHYIKIHDQGGKFEFDYLDGRHMVLGMRNTWSFGMQRETFVIFIQEGSQTGKTLIYSWGEPGADRIGFNPGWIRVQCDLDTPKNIALQHGLRPDS